MNFIDLFAGIGGFSLGLERAGMTCVAHVEIDPFCRAVLEKHWPHVPRWSDIREVDPDELPDAELICGGFPCQDVSVAGRGTGLDGERSGLWWEMHAVIRVRRPCWLLIENVPRLRTLGADAVLAALEGLGYTCWPTVVGAWAVGAPHKRDRGWIVGRLADATAPRSLTHSKDVQAWKPQSGDAGCDRLADSQSPRLEGLRPDAGQPKVAEPGDDHSPMRWPARPGEPQHGWEEPRLANPNNTASTKELISERSAHKATKLRRSSKVAKTDGDSQREVGVATHGVSPKLVRRWNRNALRAAGNAVVPPVVEVFGRWILQANRGSQ